MNYQHIFALSEQGLKLETLRMETVANNIANQNSMQRADGRLFRPSRVEAEALPFENYLLHATNNQGGISNIQVIEQDLPPNKSYQPGHPFADPEGFVSYPGVSTVDEMTTLLQAARAYEANLKIINISHTLSLQALTIGEER